MFFWDIDSKRVHVGLSRCNISEAKAVINLLEWFIGCGIPASCITVITRQREQKNKLRNELISTVDRYQGEENDFIILSITSKIDLLH